MATKNAASKGAKKNGTGQKSSAGRAGTKVGANERIIHVQVSQNNCTDWVAVQDSRPPLTPRLRVTGRCTFPTPGYKVTIRESVPQGINPRILLLTKTVTPPKGIQPQVLQTILVGYEKNNAKTEYTHVTIMPEGKTIKVKQVT